jgi:hypothetical protein
MRNKMLGSVFSSLIFALAGCPDSATTTPRTACEDESVNLCAQFYQCLTPAQIIANGLPSSESACVTQLEAQQGCEARTDKNACMGGNQVFHPDQAETCVKQIEGLTCGEIVSLNVTPYTPACQKVCAIPGT